MRIPISVLPSLFSRKMARPPQWIGRQSDGRPADRGGPRPTCGPGLLDIELDDFVGIHLVPVLVERIASARAESTRTDGRRL